MSVDVPHESVAVRSPRLRLALLALLVVGASLVVLAAGGPSVDGIRDVVDRGGWAAPVVFVVLYAVLTVAFLPGSVLTAASGVLFGTLVGTLLTVIGASIGAAAAFGIGRRIGRDAVAELAGERVLRLDAWIARRGFIAVLYARLIPFVPFNALNYVAGVTGVRARDYLVATTVGIIPGSFAYAALGGNLDDPSSPAFIAAVALVVGLALAGPFIARRTDPTATTHPGR